MNRAVIPLVIFLAMAGLFMFTLDKMEDGEYNPRNIPTEFIGRAAPRIQLPDLFDADKIVDSEEFKGQVWLMNVWGTWCAECWREHPYLVKLVDREQIPIVGIDWRDERPDALNMLTRLGNPFIRIGFDPDSSAVIDWGVYGAPETFLIDAEGIVREKHTGPMSEPVWQDTFKPYFDEARAES